MNSVNRHMIEATWTHEKWKVEVTGRKTRIMRWSEKSQCYVVARNGNLNVPAKVMDVYHDFVKLAKGR